GFVADAARPGVADIDPAFAAFQHGQDLPHHDARSFVCWLAVAYLRVSHNKPAQFQSLGLAVRSHSVLSNPLPNWAGLQAGMVMASCGHRLGLLMLFTS